MKKELLMIMDLLEMLTSRIPHGGKNTREERVLRDKLSKARQAIRELP